MYRSYLSVVDTFAAMATPIRSAPIMRRSYFAAGVHAASLDSKDARSDTLKPTTTRQYDGDLNPNDRTYAQAVSLKIMLNKCSGPSNWAQRLKDLIDEFPDTPIDKMGFPQDWKTRTIWES